MKRWWVRLLIWYLITGFLGIALSLVIFHGLTGSVHKVFIDPGMCFLDVLTWPYLLLEIIGDPRVIIDSIKMCLDFLGCAVLSYALIAYIFPKPYAKGLCPTCGYDLRATPSRCPECGTVVQNTTTEHTQTTEKSRLAAKGAKDTKAER